MEKLTRLASRFYDIKGMEYAYTQVRKMIEEELNFLQEATSMQLIKQNLAAEAYLKIPEIHPDYCTNRVLTTTFYEGVKISEIAQIDEWEIDKRALANRLVNAYCKMVFEDGFYHADPHPGNILVQEDGSLVLLDFGAVATVAPNTRTGLLELIEAATKNDTEKIIQALKKLGFIADERQAERISERVIEAIRNFLQNEVQFDGLSLKDVKVDPLNNSLFNLTTQIGLKKLANTMQVPKDYVLLNRMVTLLLGICNTLDIHTNPLEVVQPYFQKFILGERGDFVKYATDLVQKSLVNTIALPNDIRKTLKKVQRGDIEIQSRFQKEKMTIFLAVGKGLIYSVLLTVSAGFAYLFYNNGQVRWSRYALTGMAFFLLLIFLNLRNAKKTLKELN